MNPHLPWILLGACLWARLVAADARPWLPSYAETRQRAAERTAQRLEQTLLSLPGVVKARVHITVSDVSHLPLDQATPPTRVAAWIAQNSKGPSDDAVRALLATAAPDMPPETIRIVRQNAATVAVKQRLTSVGPFRVARDSAGRLTLLLTVLLSTNVCLCAIVLRGRRPRWGRRIR